MQVYFLLLMSARYERDTKLKSDAFVPEWFQWYQDDNNCVKAFL